MYIRYIEFAKFSPNWGVGGGGGGDFPVIRYEGASHTLPPSSPIHTVSLKLTHTLAHPHTHTCTLWHSLSSFALSSHSALIIFPSPLFLLLSSSSSLFIPILFIHRFSSFSSHPSLVLILSSFYSHPSPLILRCVSFVSRSSPLIIRFWSFSSHNSPLILLLTTLIVVLRVAKFLCKLYF